MVGGTRQTTSLPSCSFYSNGEDTTKKITMECGERTVKDMSRGRKWGRAFRGSDFSIKTWRVRVSQTK